jgi:origin recognition complex subunit 2
MVAARPSKRARRQSTPEADAEDGLEGHASASHLVSFLTGYDNHNPSRDSDGEEEDDDEEHERGGHDSDDDDDEEDEEEDMDEATPMKRGKTGLIGTPGSRATPRSTPSKPRKTPTPRKPKAAATPTQARNDGDAGFIRPSKSDAYFLSTSRSAKTSGNSYSALVRPLSQAQYEKYASYARSKGKAKAVVQDLEDGLVDRFEQWSLELEQGFNLMTYGFGSKRKTLNRFATDVLCKKGHCVIVNGHFPQIGIRDVLSQIEDAISIPQDIPVPSSANTPLERAVYRCYAHFLPPEAVPRGKTSTWPVAAVPLYLIIHNIDSPTLRTPRSLGILSLLACSPNIHIIASFDHLHTPLLFSATQTNTPPHQYPPGGWSGTPLASRGFNWIYHNLTTFDDYDVELTYQRLSASSTTLGGITSSSAGGISEEGALQILKSVPPMALRLIKLLLSKQLSALPPEPSSHTAHPLAATAPVFALDNDIMQRLSREKFIAREEERYNALMGEFKDHGLVVEAPVDQEGRTGRWIWVPLGKAAVERVLDTMSEVDV